jgi:hypothetical protein
METRSIGRLVIQEAVHGGLSAVRTTTAARGQAEKQDEREKVNLVAHAGSSDHEVRRSS